MPKDTGLRLFTKSFSTTSKQVNSEPSRPLTATLEKPQVLDVRLITTIDMSLMRKEFLCITNLCRAPISVSAPRRKPSVCIERPNAENILPSKKKLRRSVNNLENRNCVGETYTVKQTLVKIKTRGKQQLKTAPHDGNNRNTYSVTRTRIDTTTTKLPQPCKTCGRPDQPERFHSHPENKLKLKQKRMEENIAMNNIVQKRDAIKYNSEQKRSSNKKMQNTQIIKAGKGPRTLRCYICGKEFGTMSLPLHESKCIEANSVPCKNCGRTFYPARLDVHKESCKSEISAMSKPPDRKNTPALPKAENDTTNLVQPKGVHCSVCGRMFGTKSIKFHEPQCLKKWHMMNDHLPKREREPMYSELEQAVATSKIEESVKSPNRESSSKKPPMFPCYLCGRLFSVNSIYIHEPQCLKKWHIENDKLPPNKRKQEPLKPDVKFTRDGHADFGAMAEANWQCHLQQLIPCNNCGRTFNPDRVCTHEKTCKDQSRKLKQDLKV